MVFYQCDLGAFGVTYHFNKRDARTRLRQVTKDHLTKDGDVPFAPTAIERIVINNKAALIALLNEISAATAID
jgi:hypothetical protein